MSITTMNSDEIVRKYGKRKIIIFGAGNDGTRFYKTNIHLLDIACFIDNGNVAGHTVYGRNGRKTGQGMYESCS